MRRQKTCFKPFGFQIGMKILLNNTHTKFSAKNLKENQPNLQAQLLFQIVTI